LSSAGHSDTPNVLIFLINFLSEPGLTVSVGYTLQYRCVITIFINGFLVCFELSETKADSGAESRLPDAGSQLSIDIALGRKRKIESSANDDSDDEASLAPPSNDIYRQRQQKKVK